MLWETLIRLRDCIEGFRSIPELRNVREGGARWLLAAAFPRAEANADTSAEIFRPLNRALAP